MDSRVGMVIRGRVRQRVRVLVRGDDPVRAGHLASALAAQGMVPSLAFEGEQLVDFVDDDDFDLVVVDLEPSVGTRTGDLSDGAAVTVLTDLADRSDATLATLGGSDALTLELFARGVHALPPSGGFAETARALRTLVAGQPGTAVPSLVTHGPLALDVHRRTATWQAQPLALTKLQFRLLVALAVASGDLVSRAELHRAIYGNAPVDDGERVVAHVRRVRDKIEPRPSRPEFLLTVRGEGFRLADAF